jgi:1-aminocyclopropane-1-carboxylate deaminase/D-cysteine desulfhydrase-like pyridoxal-dependent ACC family enzyme
MLPTPLQLITNDLLQSKKINLYIKREDLNHLTIQGNKFRKLKYNLAAAKVEGKTTLLTFGGAFSNHIYAVAAAGKAFDFRTIGVIRGERIEPLNPTLAFAEANGMKLHFVTRSAYRNKYDVDFTNDLKRQFGDFYLVPEGGSNALAVKGCAEIIDEIDLDFDVICSAVGTGGTLAGLILGTQDKGKVLGFPALKGGDFLKDEIEILLKNKSENKNWDLIIDYHFGGYAKFKPELIDFMNDFKRQFDIQLEPIYTGKMLFGIFDLIKNDFFKANTTIIAIHTGGLQGVEGFNKRFGDLLV